MASKSISLNLSSGGGRQTIPQVSEDTNMEIITIWSNSGSALDTSVCKAHVYLIRYNDEWPDTDDIYAIFTIDGYDGSGSIAPEPTIIYNNTDITDDVINNWDYNQYEHGWEVGLERAVFPYQSTDYDITLQYQFTTGEIIETTIHVTGDP